MQHLIKDDILYEDSIQLLKEVKLTESPRGVENTLRNHPKVKQFIKNYQKKLLKDLEFNLDML